SCTAPSHCCLCILPANSTGFAGALVGRGTDGSPQYTAGTGDVVYDNGTCLPAHATADCRGRQVPGRGVGTLKWLWGGVRQAFSQTAVYRHLLRLVESQGHKRSAWQ